MRHLMVSRMMLTGMFVLVAIFSCGVFAQAVLAQDAEVTDIQSEAAEPASTESADGLDQTEVVPGETAAADSHGDAHGSHHGPSTGHHGDTFDSLLALQTEKAIWTVVVFLLMMLGLYLLAWKPITEALEKRERMIANNISDAQNASEQALAKLKEYEARLASAAAEATDIVTQARKDAETAGQRIINDAQAEAARQRDRALNDIESAKQTALSEMAAKSTEMAFTLARGVVRRELQPNDHQQLIQDALNQLPSRN